MMKILRWFAADTQDYTVGTWIIIAIHVAACILIVLRNANAETVH